MGEPDTFSESTLLPYNQCNFAIEIWYKTHEKVTKLIKEYKSDQKYNSLFLKYLIEIDKVKYSKHNTIICS
jgi:hypothetical protein